jgi:Uma2 family endonuclease
LITADELQSLPDDGSFLYELDRGRLIDLCPASAYASLVAGTVLIELGSYVKQHGLGVCFGADGGFKLASDPDTVRATDVSFVRAERIPGGGIPRQGYWSGAPDLAVEVLSPSNRPGELWRRIGDLLNAGTRLIWVIDPEQRRAVVIRPGNEIELLAEDGVLDGETAVPGFALPLRRVLA